MPGMKNSIIFVFASITRVTKDSTVLVSTGSSICIASSKFFVKEIIESNISYRYF